MTTARQQLEALYARKRAEGLVDVKFTLNVTAVRASLAAGEDVGERVCEELLRMEAALAEGRCTELNFNDSHRRDHTHEHHKH